MHPLRLLSYNIQVGIDTHRYRHYLTKLWRHVLPHKQRQENLEGISCLVKNFDIVALQEVDGGSIRSNFINQVQFLGESSQFNCWSQQCNRNLGKLAQHSNGLLSRLPIHQITNHKLPGRIPGRGAIEALLGDKNSQLAIYVVHLSLGKRARSQQLDYLSEVTQNFPYKIIMGDMNTPAEEFENWATKNDLNIAGLGHSLKTYPSWQPRVHLDHILVSNNLAIQSAEALTYRISDHLPLAVTIELPLNLASTLNLITNNKNSTSGTQPHG